MIVDWSKVYNIKSNLFRISLDELDVFEGQYLKNIFNALYNLFNDDFFEYEFWIISQQSHEDKLFLIPDNKKGQIVFIIADEKGRIPHTLLNQATAIFKNYIDPINSYPNLFYLPLGYNQNTPTQDIKPINERNINVFFSGNLHIGRAGLYKSLTKVPFLPFSVLHRMQSVLGLNFNYKFPDSYIQFTKAFASGLSSSEYSEKIYDSKIVICPPGYINAETFRHYEALRAGCIVISEKIPIMNLYHDCPIIQIDDWCNLDRIVFKLLDNPALMEEKQAQTLTWYNSYLKEESIAKQIYTSLKSF